ncbi:hypothetical protein QBC35DRAFT_513833 [Podospora australis]|uniref:Uncharacterized protein n=1 Tax=Podospora australis TaxID=1536484 RepID=A0AAN7ALF7_9PEZI|nr:hypothetical protein QBC35DRAFT_513833 [Podospora australis]
MSQPGCMVTQSPASRPHSPPYHSSVPSVGSRSAGNRSRSRSRSRSRGRSLGRSAQGYSPRRSVSSMKTLFPLTLSPSFHTTSSTTSTDEYPFSSSPEMDASNEPLAGCNFPEMLVWDLETSEAVFRTKSMTAGSPSTGLQISNEQLDDKSDPSRSMASSVASGLDPPPSIRMRGHSITTAATSVSDRRSSSFSHKLNLRSLPSSQPSSPTMTRHQGTWFDAEADADADTQADARSMPEMSGALGRGDSHRFGSRQSSDSAGLESGVPKQAVARQMSERPSMDDCGRPYTSMGHTLIERARVVHIPPSAIPKRKPSLNRSHHRTFSDSSASIASFHEASAMTIASHDGLQSGLNGDMQQASSASLHTRALSSGKTLVNISRPSSIDQESQRLEALRQHQAASPFPQDLGETILVDEETQHTPAADGHFAPTRTSMHSPGANRDRRANTNHHAQPGLRVSAILTPLAIPGIPLPPEVVETLRVSVSCFPETMLLTTSLSIETIRTYSKKFRHRRHSDNDLQGDSRSLYSAAESIAKPQRKWNLHWFGHHHRNKLQQQQQQSQPQLDYPPRPTSSFSTTSSPINPAHRSIIPIKNIFPSGSDYLCDALYAHVLAYNYIGTLCAPTQVSHAQYPGAGFQGHRPSGSSMDDRSRNTRIPRKAASVLGMQDVTSGHMPPSPMSPQRSRSRRLLSREHFDRISSGSRSSSRVGPAGMVQLGSGTSETPGMRDLHAELEKCIALLVSTLKKTEAESPDYGDGGDTTTLLIREREVHDESGEVDVLLIRALCEVVRIGES